MSAPEEPHAPQPVPSPQGPGGPPRPPAVATNAPWPDAPPPSIPGFELLEEIAQGGIAVVYKARHLATGRLVAVKVASANGWASAEHQAPYLWREAQVMASLSPHPHIVPLYEVSEHQGGPYLVMALAEGGDLARRLTAGPLAIPEAARALEAIARAVQHAHDSGIVHRNLKPSKVLFGGAGMPWLGGFGMACEVEAIATGAVVGTPSYMAPEQARGEPVGPAADVYGLGATLYHALTGRPPLQGKTALDTLMSVIQRAPDRPSLHNPAVPRDLDAICLRCLEKKPQDRYPSAAALADDLARFLAGQPIAARPAGPLRRAWRWLSGAGS